MKQVIMSSALALLLLIAGCSRNTPPQQPNTNQTATPASSATSDAENLNSVEGNFTIVGFFAKGKPPETIALTQAYARRVKNGDDKTKQDILILLTEKPVARKVLAAADEDEGFASSSLSSKLEKRGTRGIQLRFPADKKPATGSEQQGAHSAPEPEFAQTVFFDGSAIQTNQLETKLITFNAETVQGQITARGDWEGKFNISFKVALRPRGWTGGLFYAQPPSNLEPGKANGQIVVDGVVTKLNYVYARQPAHDMFDEKERRVRLIFTERAVGEDALGDETEQLLRLRDAGNSFVLFYELKGDEQSYYPEVWAVGKLPKTQATVTLKDRSEYVGTITAAELDLAKLDASTVDGRIYTTGEHKTFGHTYEIDVSFNAQLKPPDTADAPVTASNSQPLPADGGPPGAAYLSFLKAVEATQNLKELERVLEASLSARPLAEMKESLAKISAAEEKASFELFKAVILIKDARIEGGFISNDKATLSVAGTDGGQKAQATVNMHLENGQWKVGAGSTRIGDKK